MPTAEVLAAIVQRVFVERRSTLLSESAGLQAADLGRRCLDLRGQMPRCLRKLPLSAFEPRPGRQAGEAGWTAGEIVSHNSDRLLWALAEAVATAEAVGSALPHPPPVVAGSAAREPRPLGRDLALEVLQAATGHLMAVLPPLLAADRGRTVARTHHGPMSVTSWLLLVCIHDTDHLQQLRTREGARTLRR
ncbi:MAG: hypothetical protein AB1505_15585 [Candidatus Latescibacterota bacterium]